MQEKICRSFFHKDVPSPNPQQVRQWDVGTNYKNFDFKVKTKQYCFYINSFPFSKNFCSVIVVQGNVFTQ